MENSGLISDPEWRSMLSTIYGELYSTVAETGFRYWEREDTIVSDGQAEYALPDEHFSTIGVDYEYTANNYRRRLREQMVQERNRYSGVTSSEAFEYTLVARNLLLQPTPPAGQTYYHLYVPQPVDFSFALGQRQSITTNTVKLVSASDVRNFRIGDVVSASPNSDKTSPRSGTTRVTSFDRATGAVTLEDASAIVGFADNDYLFLHELDVVTPDGENFLTWGVTVLALAKEESDTRDAKSERERAIGRVVEMATLRAMNEPRRPMVGTGYEGLGDELEGHYLDRGAYPFWWG
jgi:hypothetical protein